MCQTWQSDHIVQGQQPPLASDSIVTTLTVGNWSFVTCNSLLLPCIPFANIYTRGILGRHRWFFLPIIVLSQSATCQCQRLSTAMRVASCSCRSSSIPSHCCSHRLEPWLPSRPIHRLGQIRFWSWRQGWDVFGGWWGWMATIALRWRTGQRIVVRGFEFRRG